MGKLSITDHDRDKVGLTYVYPVISRRSEGLSIGINLNPNNACNWHCVYCQVPGLKRGSAPRIKLNQFKTELDSFLHSVLYGNFYDDYAIVPAQRTIKDIAISGNGEPTSATRFDDIIELIQDAMLRYKLLDTVKLILITNGSLAHKKTVQAGLEKLQAHNGVVWFKLDSGTDHGLQTINRAALSIERVKHNLQIMSNLCEAIWIQTCLFKRNGIVLPEKECVAYLEFLGWIKSAGITIRGVLLYSLARTSMQAEASELSPVSEQWLTEFAGRITQLGYQVKNYL